MIATLSAALLTTLLPLAQQATEPRGYNLSWAIILFCVILGLTVALRPTKREAEVKKTKEIEG